MIVRAIGSILQGAVGGFAFTMGSLAAREVNKRYSLFPHVEEPKKDDTTSVKETPNETK